MSLSVFRLYSTLLLTALIIIASGCAVQQPLQNPVSWDDQQQLSQLNQWHISGKMGYRQGSKGGSAWLDWQQDNDNFEVILSGPFGAKATSIQGNSQFTRLQQADQKPIVATSATELTAHLFGWRWPVEELRYWVRGIPSPLLPTESETKNEFQLLSTLEQAGWQLSFSRYSKQQQWHLPGKIHGKLLTNNTDISFTLVIKSWRIDPVTVEKILP